MTTNKNLSLLGGFFFHYAIWLKMQEVVYSMTTTTTLDMMGTTTTMDDGDGDNDR